jgi:hypothetical protein
MPCPRTRVSWPHGSPRCSSAPSSSTSGWATPTAARRRQASGCRSGLAPDAFGLPYDGAAAAIASHPITALIRAGEPDANTGWSAQQAPQVNVHELAKAPA